MMHHWVVLHWGDRSWGYLGVRHTPFTASLRGGDVVFLLGWTRDLWGLYLDLVIFTAGET
ncbi:hypothetical protein BDP81DRAFT_416928 [Colletotrichum phormii]|uniref:Uncharacterized protein n=1 Tax=Colletotrichum phormii TaxID=359342 RepID=A0AAJ0EKA1_9PEZI|nr:uncharacterized protein BDP81DRAFT_416928 [Colletotrichum phormii]KAK1654961.1 hypothetical protein BDP81DRAFT_416928 [Colletotrichum phormii]